MFNEEYKKLEITHTKVKTEAEAHEKDIEYKTARKNKLTCVIKLYKHSKIITEFSDDLWNGLLYKCLVFHDHIKFRWKYTNKKV